MNTHLRRTTGSVAMAIVAGLTLSGCFFNPVDAAKREIEKQIEQETGGKVSIGELPADFPKGEVPLVDGDVAGAVADPEKHGWVITVVNENSDAMAKAVEKLKGAGFAEEEQGNDQVHMMKNGKWQVMLIGSGDGVMYTVMPIGE